MRKKFLLKYLTKVHKAGWKYYACDNDSVECLYKDKPYKSDEYWDTKGDYTTVPFNIRIAKWKDTKPVSLKKYIKKLSKGITRKKRNKTKWNG